MLSLTLSCASDLSICLICFETATLQLLSRISLINSSSNVRSYRAIYIILVYELPISISLGRKANIDGAI